MTQAAQKNEAKVGHTPGPWDYTKDTLLVYADDIIIADAETLSNPQNEANARLIAAAPDYYEGCKDLPQSNGEEPTADYDKRVLEWFYSNAGTLYAANAKARGE